MLVNIRECWWVGEGAGGWERVLVGSWMVESGGGWARVVVGGRGW